MSYSQFLLQGVRWAWRISPSHTSFCLSLLIKCSRSQTGIFKARSKTKNKKSTVQYSRIIHKAHPQPPTAVNRTSRPAGLYITTLSNRNLPANLYSEVRKSVDWDRLVRNLRTGSLEGTGLIPKICSPLVRLQQDGILGFQFLTLHGPFSSQTTGVATCLTAVPLNSQRERASLNVTPLTAIPEKRPSQWHPAHASISTACADVFTIAGAIALTNCCWKLRLTACCAGVQPSA